MTLFHDQGFEKEQQAEVPHNCFHFLFGLSSVVIRAEVVKKCLASTSLELFGLSSLLEVIKHVQFSSMKG
jgi:hypothetical protein